ncbi:MAG: hypothetical protein HFI82_10595 [Eubacterium sp.]|jgi:hypothetical protein|nr:hypothetical protein [Eubacterium sp.]
MANKTLSYFMRPELKEEEIVEIQGPETIKDEKGEAVVFKIKRLSQAHINKIYENYRTEKVAMDRKRKQPYVVDGKVVMQETRDNRKAYRHVIVDALVYPDLRDKELMAFFGCVDVTDMPEKMFTSAEYDYVARMVNQVLGLGLTEETEDKEEFEEAKN